MPKKVLVIAAHPDDEILGCGGTVARHAEQGDEVFHLILGEGHTSRAKSRDRADRANVQRLAKLAEKAGVVVGAKTIKVLDFPDNRFDSVDLLDLVKAVEDVAAAFAPEIVYTHHVGDLNVDHQQTARAVLTAFRPIPGTSVRKILAFEVASATDWAGPAATPFLPTVWTNIEKTLSKKIKALEVYGEEMRPFPHSRSLESIRAQVTRWGAVAGVPAAEAFMLLREIQP